MMLISFAGEGILYWEAKSSIFGNIRTRDHFIFSLSYYHTHFHFMLYYLIGEPWNGGEGVINCPFLVFMCLQWLWRDILSFFPLSDNGILYVKKKKKLLAMSRYLLFILIYSRSKSLCFVYACIILSKQKFILNKILTLKSVCHIYATPDKISFMLIRHPMKIDLEMLFCFSIHVFAQDNVGKQRLQSAKFNEI